VLSVPLLRTRRQAAAFAAVLALLLTQALGLAHRVVHAPHSPVELQSTAQQPGHPSLAAAFDQHDEGSAECRLIDQAGHGDAVAAPTLAPGQPVAPDSAPPPRPAAGFIAACTQPYSARGPPLPLA
jgi:hypothetical protein